MDLPGFGRSAKPAHFPYSIEGYGDWLEAFRRHLGWDAYRLFAHDWGAVGLAMAQREPERVERLVISDAVPFLPGYRWHRFARIWRTPVVGELFQGSTTKWALRRFLPGMPEDLIDSIWDHYDHGTQRAVLKLYRSAPPDVLARAGERLGEIKASSARPLGRSRSLPADRASPHDYVEALGGQTTVGGRRGREPLAVDRQAGARRAVVRLPAAEPRAARAGPGGRRDRRALPDPRPAHGRPRRASVPRRPVRPRGVHDLERQLVRRPPHPGLLGAVPAARALPHAAGGRGALGGRGGSALRAARARSVRRAREVGRAVVRHHRRGRAVHGQAPVPLRRRRRAWAHCSRCSGTGCCWRAGSRSCARSPVRWRACSSPSPRSPTR